MDPRVARRLWHALEPINALTYFASECRDVPMALGLQGFWMGYFAGRAAAMGAVESGVVEATFYNFHPDRVRRAIPDAWTCARPQAVVTARAAAASAALRRLLGADVAEELAAAVVPALTRTVEHGVTAGRPLFATNAAVQLPDDPVAALWQCATTLREHRGDGHVALLAAATLDGCEVHALFAAEQHVDPQLYQQSRGWSPDDWSAATDRLAVRGVLDAHGSLTDRGARLRVDIEQQTDALALPPYAALGDDAVEGLLQALEPAAARIGAAGEISFPNPMGLPRL